MSPLFKKLNLKGQGEVVVLNSPQSLEAELVQLENLKIHHDLESAQRVHFALVFVTKQDEVNKAAKGIAAKLEGDAVVWFAYPKGSSKKYQCDFNRDTGWTALGELGLEPVRQVAIDQDWSALRFRQVEFIKSMTRSFAMTEQGKEKVERGKIGRSKG
jgi:hypothetical protein